jgi:hypothetical protein
MATLSSRLSPLTVSVPAMSDWVSYTPTWTGSITNPAIGNGSITGFWRRVGDSVQITVTLLTGSTTTYGSGNWIISIPDGLSIDFAKIPSTSMNGNHGSAYLFDSSTTTFKIAGARIQTGTTSGFLISIGEAVTNLFVTPTAPWTWAQDDALRVSATIPISGWTSHVATTTGPNALVVGGQSVGSTLNFGATSNQGFNILANNAAAIASTAAGALTLGLPSKIGSSDYAGQAIVGRTNGAAISAGYVGEIVEGKQTSATSFPTTATYGDGASVSLTSGVWLLSAYIDGELNGSTTQSILIGISTSSGTSGSGLSFGDTLVACLPPTGTSNTSACMPQVIFRPTTTTTHYLKVRAEYSAGTPRYRCRLTAVRIA